MALHPTILLILTGLTGVHSVITLSKVSVKAGDSITIPCLYDSKYKNNVKYLCGGKDWSSCSYLVKTDKPDISGKFSISDNKTERIFSVTIKHLNNMHTDFWCIVEINYGPDHGTLFHLSVTSGLPGLYVKKQEIRGFIGDSITISCYHSTGGEVRWCKLGKSCVTGKWGAIDGTNVTIDSEVQNVSLVSMSGLTKESSGWYFCKKEHLQMPVHVNVTDKPNTTDTWTSGGQTHHSSSMSLIICLSLLVIVLLALFIWFMLKKHKENKSETAAITMAEAEVTYCNLKHQRKTSAQRACTETDMDVLYSSVVTIRQPTVRRAEAQDTDVTNSM